MPRFQQSAGRGGRSTDGAPNGVGISHNDQVYFDSYANTGIHEEMIKVRGSLGMVCSRSAISTLMALVHGKLWASCSHCEGVHTDSL